MPVTLPELARTHTALDYEAIVHLKRLVASWHMLSDFCFADLLLFTPVAGQESHRFVVLDQIRPTTGQTMYRDDMVGVIYDEVERPLVARAFRLGEVVEGSVQALGGTERTWRFCVPVRHGGEVVAVMTRESPTTVARRLGELERVYLEIFERFAHMVAEGWFPFPSDDALDQEAPRVGDGVIFIDRDRRVRFTSPNAVTAMHRVGIHANAEGARLADVGFDEAPVTSALDLRMPVTEESERGETTIIMHAIPLLTRGEPDGAVLLLRDVSDLRRRDRMLLSKDATIREIHHRVKNNLQTIASLLRLQGRRLTSEEAKLAIEESVRRIRSIALVHETLSRDVTEAVDFGEICRPLVRMIRESMLAPDRPVNFSVEGDAGELPAEIATPLAVVVNELIQNAVDHAFPLPPGSPAETAPSSALPELHHVWVTLARSNDAVSVDIRDDGAGLPSGFSLESSRGLGLSIVHSLVTSELGGSIQMKDDGGTWVHLVVPVPEEAEEEPI
ncbi:MAG: sensor histidine kinase [Actinobacteria bacterium]|nr:sensor histidine kinase [Actinomycetota bacterium]